MSGRPSLLCGLCLAIFFSITTATYAQGIVIPRDSVYPWHPDPYGPTQPITLERESVEISLSDQFAHVQIVQVFRNNTRTDLEGTFVFPLPTDADISSFALWMDGRQLNSETLEATEASRIYQDIVARMRDPGLLEYVGRGLIQASVYPIPANGTKQVDIKYNWLLPIEDSLIRMDLPLKLDGYSIDLVGSLTITVEIDSPDPLGSIYSPTHDIDVDRHGPRGATVSLEKQLHRPETDFVLYVSRPEGAVGLNVLNHSTGTDEGYFLAMIAPEYNEAAVTIAPKDFVFVLDKSGSMSGRKIEQAKDALKFVFQNLNSDDRFNLVTFASVVNPYFEGWRKASVENLTDVRDYIDGINADGSTNIEEALAQACSLSPDRERPMYIVFLTDGLPTVGNTNTDWLIQHMNTLNEELNARLFCFGVGDDVDYPFIDRLARENGGYTSSVGPYEDLEQPLSDFYSKIKSPVMTDIEVEITGTRVYDLLPVTMPDLFLGSQLIITGRYRGEGDVECRLSGVLNGRRVTFVWPVELRRNIEDDFVARHWATRRVGQLLNEIRLYGENEESVDEIIRLAQRYGIITPYTSMLVTEDRLARQGWDMNEAQVQGFYSATQAPGGGGFGGGGGPASTAQRESVATQDMEFGKLRGQEEALQQYVQYQAGKTFYQNAEMYWVDSEYDEEEYETVRIAYLSDEYFDLIDEEPDIAQYLAVGSQVIVVYDEVAYQIDPAE